MAVKVARILQCKSKNRKDVNQIVETRRIKWCIQDIDLLNELFKSVSDISSVCQVIFFACRRQM